MTEAEVYILAETALDNVISQIKADQWGLKIPDWFALGGTQDRASITLKEIINYHAYDTAWVPETLAGKTIAEVGSKYDGDLLSPDPAAAYHTFSQVAIGAVKTSYDPTRLVHLTYGEYPAGEYLKHITSFRAFRAYDIAKLIGADTKLSDELVEGLWEQLAPEVETWRKLGVYGPAIPVPDNADRQAKLLGLVGRNPF